MRKLKAFFSIIHSRQCVKKNDGRAAQIEADDAVLRLHRLARAEEVLDLLPDVLAGEALLGQHVDDLRDLRPARDVGVLADRLLDGADQVALPLRDPGRDLVDVEGPGLGVVMRPAGDRCRRSGPPARRPAP